MHLMPVDGVDVAVETLGANGDRPVLHLHGFPVDHRILRGPLERIYAAHPGWRRSYVDLPGFGAAPPAAAMASSDDALRIVLGLVAELGAGRPAVLVGQSWGGYLALAAACRHPELVAGLVLVCPMTVPEHAVRDVPVVAPPEIPAAVAAGADPGDLAEFRDIAVVADERHFAFFREAVLPALRTADADTVERVGAAYALAAPPTAPYPGPALVLAGRDDAIVGYRDAWRATEALLPHATFVALDGAGHHAHVEHEETFAALVGAFLDRLAAAG